jgi:hypothetical protein
MQEETDHQKARSADGKDPAKTATKFVSVHENTETNLVALIIVRAKTGQSENSSGRTWIDTWMVSP